MQVVADHVINHHAMIQILCAAGCKKYLASFETKGRINDKACVDVNVIVLVTEVWSLQGM